jgi:hypothetical protein
MKFMGTVRYGINPGLEELATQMILDSLEGETSRLAKSDILTPWKTKHRALHEILSRTGAPIDPAIMRGSFNREWNRDKPHLNSREGHAQAPRMSTTWNPDEAQPTGLLSPQMASVMGVERLD